MWLAWVFVSHITLHFVCLTAYNSSVMALFGSAAGAHGGQCAKNGQS